MLPAFRPPVFQGTPPAPAGSTGWFDREGLERPLAGIYPGDRPSLRNKPYALVERPCGRCGGAGGSDKWAHTGWTCFDCSGRQTRGESAIRLYRAEELAVLNDRREIQRTKKAAARAVEAAAEQERLDRLRADRAARLALCPFYEVFGGLVSTFAPDRSDPDETRPLIPDFLRQMWDRIQTHDLTPAQQAAVEKFIARAEERKVKEKTSEFLGTIGGRIEFVARVVMCKPIYPNVGHQFGQPEIRYLIKFETLDHQTLTWFTSRPRAEGTTVRGTAKVTQHKEFRGIRETQIGNFRAKGEVDEKQAELF